MNSDNPNYDQTGDIAIVEVGKVLEAVRTYGAYYSVAFDDPVTQAVITHAYSGWTRLCSECDAPDFCWEFARTWAAYFRQGVRRFGHLAGTFEITNRRNGFYHHIPPPKLIGDPEKARAVLEAAKIDISMSSKPRIKAGTSGAARVECYPCREDVEALLAQGSNVKSVYELMKKHGRVTCSYQAFSANMNRWRWSQ